jgi:acyl dehydratase
MNPAMKKHLDLFFAKRPGLHTAADFPHLATRGEIRWDAERTAAYAAICGLPAGPTLPLLVPQIAAAKLHLDLFADRQFPFGALGIVHIENRVELLAPIPASAVLELAASVGNCRPWRPESSAGWLFDLRTDVSVAGVPKGTWTATILARSGRDDSKSSSREAGKEPGVAADAETPGVLVRSAVVTAPENIGRRYGAIASDRNPIHQHALLAKPFGFKRAIAHGLWTLARTLGEAVDDLPTSELSLHARFKKPIFLPGRFLVEVRKNEGELRLLAQGVPFEKSSERSRAIPHLAVTVTSGRG